MDKIMDKSIFEKLNDSNAVNNAADKNYTPTYKELWESGAYSNAVNDAADNNRPLTYDDLRNVHDSMKEPIKPFTKELWVSDTDGNAKQVELLSSSLIHRETLSNIDLWVVWLMENKWNIGTQTGNRKLFMRIEDGHFMTKYEEDDRWQKKMIVGEFMKARKRKNIYDTEIYYKQASGLIPDLKDIIDLI